MCQRQRADAFLLSVVFIRCRARKLEDATYLRGYALRLTGGLFTGEMMRSMCRHFSAGKAPRLSIDQQPHKFRTSALETQRIAKLQVPLTMKAITKSLRRVQGFESAYAGS